MTDLTYTAQGTFDDARKVTLNVCIPAPNSEEMYQTELYNLSKTTSSGTINAVFCHFSNVSELPIRHDKFDYRIEFNLDNLKKHPRSTAFDEKNSDALFIFFHNIKFELSDREAYFAQIEDIYENVKNNGNQSQDGINPLTSNAVLTHPRKVGMSLVIKLRT